MLLKAQKGELTKREYYEANKDLLEQMLYNRFLKTDETGISAIDQYRGEVSKEDFDEIIKSYIQYKIDQIDTMEGIKGLSKD